MRRGATVQKKLEDEELELKIQQYWASFREIIDRTVPQPPNAPTPNIPATSPNTWGNLWDKNDTSLLLRSMFQDDNPHDCVQMANQFSQRHDAAQCQDWFEFLSELFQKIKPKRHRRRGEEIIRTFKCTVQGCQKAYGSEGALKYHFKRKHPADKYSRPKKEENRTIHEAKFGFKDESGYFLAGECGVDTRSSQNNKRKPDKYWEAEVIGGLNGYPQKELAMKFSTPSFDLGRQCANNTTLPPFCSVPVHTGKRNLGVRDSMYGQFPDDIEPPSKKRRTYIPEFTNLPVLDPQVGPEGFNQFEYDEKCYFSNVEALEQTYQGFKPQSTPMQMPLRDYFAPPPINHNTYFWSHNPPAVL